MNRAVAILIGAALLIAGLYDFRWIDYRLHGCRCTPVWTFDGTDWINVGCDGHWEYPRAYYIAHLVRYGDPWVKDWRTNPGVIKTSGVNYFWSDLRKCLFYP